LKKSKEETEKCLEEYRAQKGDIEMVSGFVSILLRESIPGTVHDWKLADIRARLGTESEADLMKHDVNIMVKLIMALKNFDHGNNKELIAYYKANVGRVRRCPLELPLRGSMVEGKLSNRSRDGTAMVLCTRENSPTEVRTVQFG
jgi:hypothetical protein